jgi:hypothetical protein
MFFFLIDRIENQITRKKIEEIQIRYCEIIRLYITKIRVNYQIHFSKLLLLLSKLRALDALIAERLLCLQMNTDGQVQKCIFEVLHRETINIVEVNYFVFISSILLNFFIFRTRKFIFSMQSIIEKKNRKYSVRCHCAL